MGHMLARVALGCIVAAALGVGACIGLDGLSSGPSVSVDAGPDATQGAPDAPAPDADASEPPMPATCGRGVHGPTMVDAGSFCIDTTEVTQGQYFEFLTAKAGVTTGQPSVCSWNTSYAPN